MDSSPHPNEHGSSQHILFRISFILVLIIAFSGLSILHSVKSYAFDRAYYEQQFVSNNVYTQFNKTTVDVATDQLWLYLKNEPADLGFFSERDQLHLVDVQRLFQKGFFMYYLSIGILLAIIAIGSIVFRKYMVKIISMSLMVSGVVNLALVSIAYLARDAFERLFLQFHLIAFDNEYWILNPSSDKLIQLFPEAFWHSITTKIVLMVLWLGVIYVYSGIFIRIYICKKGCNQ